MVRDTTMNNGNGVTINSSSVTMMMMMMIMSRQRVEVIPLSRMIGRVTILLRWRDSSRSTMRR